jgi:3-(methylthio)propanoyl-CoA dehydrogenase
MSDYTAPTKDMQFVIESLANLDVLNQLPGYQDATADMVEAILEQAGRFASEIIAPLNQSGDQHGAQLEDGKVIAPPGFADAYRQFTENGWMGLDQPPEFDGQGMPYLMQSAVAEMWNSANMAFTLCPLLTGGAIEALKTHAPDAMKQKYLPEMIAGRFTGTMNLTEPQAGSDLSAVRSKAVPDGDFYRISGQKIFITWGEHDMAENIIHLVLARLPGAPEGVKGISLFLVPKFLVNDDGSLGERNDLNVVSLEHKLGIHASPTCVMSFGDNDGAIGYLIGEENNGLACMFTMMNHARLEVGMEGVGLSTRAYQHALAYAKDRIQGFAHGHEGRVSIIHHPDVRRMMMQMRAISEASRAIAYTTAASYDLAHKASDVEQRQQQQRRVELMTPVVKGWCTEMAQEATYLGIQVHGGMGFIEETGAAQYYRDARITTIYEGTTGIQAMDLMGRKILRDKGQALGELVDEIRDFVATSEAGDAAMSSILARLSSALEVLESCAQDYLAKAGEDPGLPGSISVNFLMLTGHVVGGWLMARSAMIAQERIQGGSTDPFYQNKIQTARFYAEQILSRSEGLRPSIMAGSDATMGIDVEQFD